jgi:hypothetical protein
MKSIITCCFVILMVVSCEKKYSPQETQDKLKTAMLRSIAAEKDTTKAKFQILNVFYFAEKNFYDCEFKVRMKVLGTNIDTVGFMKATISKDFETVKRKS